MIIILALILPVLFLFLYNVFFSIETAATLQWWQPKTLGTKFSIAPIFEITNVFLVFALVSVFAFFPSTVATWGPLLTIPALVFLSISGVRIIGMIYLIHEKNNAPFLKNILVITSILTPAVIVGGTVPWMIIGNTNSEITLFLGIALVLFIVSTNLVTSILFLGRHLYKNPRWYLWIWIVLLGIIWAIIVGGIIQETHALVTLGQVITDIQTAYMLFGVCGVGIIITLPGVVLAYSLFL